MKMITNIHGNIVDSMSFNSWGNRRNYDDWSQKEDPNTVHLIDRGFTNHQHLDVFNLINMGGRIYDPVIQQFLSPDPYVQMPDNPQNLNRYSYCLNSPLMYTDPTGEKWWHWLLLGMGLLDPATAIATATTAAATVAGQAVTVGVTGYVTTVFNAPFVALVGACIPGIGADKAVRNSFRITNGLFVTDKNKNFFGRTWEFFSRFSWEGLQTAAGTTWTQFRNLGGGVDRVDYFGGATFATKENKSGASVALGNYININYDGTITGDFQDFVLSLTDLTYLHEYGHTIDSKIFGPAYLFAVGISSVHTARTSKGISDPPFTTHRNKWTETRANMHAKKYFGKHYGIDWNARYHGSHGAGKWIYDGTNPLYFYYYTIEDYYPTK